ncbi:MAG: hypothetical protein EXS37_11065 [Opitutus sp.]|nr:hypothetical protein [Opitutus sp.]
MIKTPNLDAFAKQGVWRPQGYAANAGCSPSRSAPLTGRTPFRNDSFERRTNACRLTPAGNQTRASAARAAKSTHHASRCGCLRRRRIRDRNFSP